MEEYLAYGSYNAEKRDYERYPATRPGIHQISPQYKPEKIQSDWFMEYLFDAADTDENIRFLLSAVPNVPDNIYKHISLLLSRINYAWEVNEQRLARSAVKIFQELKTPMRAMHHLFLGTCLLAGDKTVRDYASHIWTERTPSEIDNRLLGSTIGRIETHELLPLKRLTDLITDKMLNISPLHNRALQELIEALLLELKTPITNTKKLLEIRTEIINQRVKRVR
jgi:hypothetical protein